MELRERGISAKPMMDQAIRERRFKLIRTGSDGSEEFYDLATDPFEKRNLLLGPPLSPKMSPEARAIYHELRTALARVRRPGAFRIPLPVPPIVPSSSDPVSDRSSRAASQPHGAARSIRLATDSG